MNTDKIYAESIANEYALKDTSKVVALKKLDRKAKLPSEIFAFSFGIVSALVLGIGMCFSMGVIGSTSQTGVVAGVIIGILGIVGVAVNYPIYKKMRANSMMRYANDIMLLAKEISEEEV